MFRLHLLGGFALDDADGGGEVNLPQRRAEALLALLAVAGPLGCTRDRLIALLWPEKDVSRARHGLRDALHATRAVLGRAALPGTGELLRLDPVEVESDVRTFAAALASGRLAEAVATYHGPLLDGFHLSGAPEFERWVDEERGRLLRECIEATKRLAKIAEHDGDWDGAADWWGRAVAHDPYNSRLVVRRMVALARGGDRANAIREGEAHCRLLTEDMELEPDPLFLEELQRVRSGGLKPLSFFTPPPKPRDGTA
jgi:DNA-binding SARP family transcriptional activator